MKRLKQFCPVLPPALFQEQQASCLNVNMFVCLMHGYIFLLYVYLLNKDGCWEIQKELQGILFDITYFKNLKPLRNVLIWRFTVGDSFLSKSPQQSLSWTVSPLAMK